MASYTLYLIAYNRGLRWDSESPKPYHWVFFVQKELKNEKNLGIAYQLRGMPGAFKYKGPENVDLRNSESAKHTLQIGEVEVAKLDLVHQRLRECRIDRVESSGWNCQDWALEGLEKLRAEGFVDEAYTEESVKHWLKET